MAKTAIIAKLTARDGRREQLLDVISDIGMSNAADEPGTEIYVAHRDQNDPNVVWFYELYTDQAAFEAHGSSQGMKAFGQAVRDLLDGRPELFFLGPVTAKGVDLQAPGP